MISRFLFRLPLICQIGKLPQFSFRVLLRIGVSFLPTVFFIDKKNASIMRRKMIILEKHWMCIKYEKKNEHDIII